MSTTALPPVPTDVAERFLQGHRLAVVGASDEPDNFGRTIVKELLGHGHEVVPVHPSATSVEGVAAAASLAEVEGALDGVVVMTGADAALEVVDQGAALGVPRVWLFRGIGSPGAASAEAIARCQEHGIEVVGGACPLMFLEPVGWAHRLHRSVRRHRGGLQVTS